MNQKISQVIAISIKLVDMKSKKIKLPNLPGELQEVEVGDFRIAYATPFSGAEVMPGQKNYMLAIWHANKKVFSADWSPVDEDNPNVSCKKWDWFDQFSSIAPKT